MSFTYWLPDETGKKVDFTTDVSSIIIIGANGSGKSKLGAWIEQQNYSQVHRIGAQRNLNFNENITLKSYSFMVQITKIGMHIKINDGIGVRIIQRN